jgi:hypothetical protein
MRYVVDASVAVKWFFQSAPDEDHLEQAITLLQASRDLDVAFIQPPHFMPRLPLSWRARSPSLPKRICATCWRSICESSRMV